METPIDLTHPAFHDEDAARAYLESVRWPNGPVCVSCGLTDFVKPLGGKSMGPGWYHCSQCREKFTVRSGSIFERSHVPLHKWLLAFRLMAASKKGFSAHELHRSIKVTYKTAWFMTHRIREAMRDDDLRDPTDDAGSLGGSGKTVEADETYVGLKEGRKKARAGYGHKRVVLTLVERGGKARSYHVENARVEEVVPIVEANIRRESHLMTDESRLYRNIGVSFESHDAIEHGKHEYGRGHIHTNTVEGYFSIFKRGMNGIYQHCGEKHLHRYLAEFDFRYNNRIKLGCDDAERTVRALRGAEGKRLYYKLPRNAAA